MERIDARQPPSALFAAIVEATDDAVVAVTLDGTIADANPAAGNMLGFAPGALRGLPLATIAVPEREGVIAGIMARLAGGGRVPTYRTFLMRKDGSRFPVSMTVSLVHGDDGAPLVAAIVREVSKDWDESPTRVLLAAIVESSEDAIYGRTPDGLVASWNPSAERLFGYARDEILGRCIRVLVPEDGLPEFDEMDERLSRGESISGWETIRLTKSGRRVPVSVSAFRVTAPDGAVLGYASITRDMLRDAEAQRAFRNLEELTAREREVLGLVSDGLGNIEISRRLGLSQQTVKNYVSRILTKLHVSSRTQAAASFLSLRGFLGPPAVSE